MKKALTILFVLLLICSPLLLQAQSKTFPDNLELFPLQKVVELGANATKGIPFYGLEGNLLSNKAAMKIRSNRDYRAEYFADTSGKFVAIKFRKTTEGEKARLQAFLDQKAALKALVGTQAKDFTAVDMNGNSINLEDLKGSVVAINFWYIGCKPCILEMPELNEIVAEHQGDDIKFVAIALDSDKTLEKFLTKREFDYDIVPAGRSIAHLYGISGYPTHCIVDQEGKIAYFQSGYGTRTAAELKKIIGKLLKR